MKIIHSWRTGSQVSRATDPSQKIIAYISGTADQISCGPTCWRNIADLCRCFSPNYGVTGSTWILSHTRRMSPTTSDYFRPFATKWGLTRPFHWTTRPRRAPRGRPPILRRHRNTSIGFMPMLYDNSSTNVSEYDAFIAQALTYQYKNLAPGGQLYPIIPSYSASTYHDRMWKTSTPRSAK